MASGLLELTGEIALIGERDVEREVGGTGWEGVGGPSALGPRGRKQVFCLAHPMALDEPIDAAVGAHDRQTLARLGGFVRAERRCRAAEVALVEIARATATDRSGGSSVDASAARSVGDSAAGAAASRLVATGAGGGADAAAAPAAISARFCAVSARPIS